MSRNSCCFALCLRVKASGESNREAWFLNEEDGIFRAAVFGGPKSKLRSHVSPFHEGKLWIYHDPVRDSRKVTDFDVETWRPGLRELYERALAADALAETVLATHGGGGSWGTALGLASKFLDMLEEANEKNIPVILLRFFWLWAEFLGIRPDLDYCHSCACETAPGNVVWYNQKEGNLYCASCRGESDLPLEPLTRNWLLESLSPETQVDSICMTEENYYRQAKNFVLGILSSAIGKHLSLWNNF